MLIWTHDKPRQLSILLSALATFGLWCGASPDNLLATAQDEATAFSSKKDSASRNSDQPVPGSPLGEGRVEEWLRLAFAEYAGPKIRIALANLEDRDSASGSKDTGERRFDTRRARIDAITHQLTAALEHTDRFDIEPSASGDNIAVEYLISGSIQDWLEASIPTAVEPQRPDLLKTGIAISLRVVDALTHQVLFATTERAQASLSGTGMAIRRAIDTATDACIERSAYRLVGWFENRSWSGRVSSVQGGLVSINAGRRQGLAVGMTLSTLAEKRDLIDPESGQFLGSVTDNRGRLEIIAVGDETAVAAIIGHFDAIEPGDRVQWRSPRS